MKYLFLITMAFLAMWCDSVRGDTLLLSEPFPAGELKTELKNGARFQALPEGGWRFIPGNKPEKYVLTIPAEPKEFRFYNQLELEIDNPNDNARLEVIVDAVKPKHGDIGKRTLRLDKGTKKYQVHLGGVGQPVQLSRLRLTVLHTPEAKQEKDISVVEKPITVKSLQLNAKDYNFGAMRKSIPAQLNAPLPDGFSAEAVKAAEAKRAELLPLAGKLMDQVKKSSSSRAEKEKRLARIYDLRDFGDWQVQYAALCVDAATSPLYGWTGGADKILRDGAFPGTIGGTVKVSLARNETEAAQIALYSPRDLNQISVSVSEFRNEAGESFPTEAITVTPVGYVKTTAPAYFSEYAPYALPDPLLGYLKEFDVEKERFQPVWLEFSASKTQAPGVYRGSVKFRGNGEELFSVPVEVTVHKFTLPDRMTFPAVVSSGIFNSPLYEEDAEVRREFEAYMYDENGGDPSKLSPAAQRLVRINDELFRMFNDHRITYQDIYRSTRRVIPGWRRQDINRYNSLYCLGYDNDRNVMENFEKQFREMRKEGTADRAYIYGYDEIRASDKRAFAGMKKSFGALKKAFPELKTMATALDYSFGEKTDTTEEVDIWVVPPGTYMSKNVRAAAERARERGKQVWYYPCNWPYPPDANLLLESRATATRLIIGFMPWKYQADGFLYYSTSMLGRQVQTDSLLGKWDLAGDVETVTDAPWDFNSSYRLRTSGEPKRDYAALSRWTMLPKNPAKPLIAEFEVLPEKFASGKGAAFTVEVRLNYLNGKTDRNFLEVDPEKKEWQKVRKEIKIAAPIRNMLYAFRLKSPDASVQIRNVKLYQEGEYSDRRLAADKLLSGGPVFDESYCYTTFRSNGDGTLFYPGPDGVLPSLRLKFLRDGLEDYEYLVLLRNAAGQVKEGRLRVADRDGWLKQAEELLKVDDAVCRGLSRYAKTGATLLEYREKIAGLLDQAQK